MKVLTVNLKELRKQINALCVSDIPHDEKEGLHNLLGSIYDSILDEGTVKIVVHKNGF